MSSGKQLNLFNRANHSNMGKDWESELKALHEMYRIGRKCDVVKNAERWIFISETEYQKLNLLDRGMIARDGNGRPMKRIGSDVDFSGGNGTGRKK